MITGAVGVSRRLREEQSHRCRCVSLLCLAWLEVYSGAGIKKWERGTMFGFYTLGDVTTGMLMLDRWCS